MTEQLPVHGIHRQDVLRQVINEMNIEHRADYETGFWAGLALAIFAKDTAAFLLPYDQDFLMGLALEIRERLERTAERILQVGEV